MSLCEPAPVGINALLSTQAIRHPDKTAIHFNDRSLSYAQLQQQIEQTVTALHQLPLQAGDRIAWYGLNHPDMLVLLFAAAHCQLLLVPLNWRLASAELQDILQDATPVCLLHDPHFASQAQALCAENTENTEDTNNCRPLTLGELLDSSQTGQPQDTTAAGSNDTASAARQTDLDHPLLIVYTSGTTGKAKGAVLSHNSVLCNARMSWDMHGMTAADHILGLLPMFHVGGFNIQVIPALLCGATVTLLEKFEPLHAVQQLSDKPISLTVVVPTILQAILTTPTWQNHRFPTLRAISIGSTDVPAALITAVHERQIPVLQVYGATETSPLAIYQQRSNAFASVGSIGRCGSECQIRLVAAGREVAPGENGEILVKGANVLSYYWNNPQATAATLQDGWFHSGDVARMDEQGFYWFADRLKHVIISGGENIYPAELERVVRDFPGISELSVVGRPHSKWGEVAVIVAVRDPHSEHSPAQLRQLLLAAFQDQLARYKHPRDVVFVAQLPRTALGKVQVDALKALLRELPEHQDSIHSQNY